MSESEIWNPPAAPLHLFQRINTVVISKTNSPLVTTSKQIIFIQQIKNKLKRKIQDCIKSISTFSFRAVVHSFAEIHDDNTYFSSSLDIWTRVWSKYERSWYHCEISCSVPQVIWVELHLWYHKRTQKTRCGGQTLNLYWKEILLNQTARCSAWH